MKINNLHAISRVLPGLLLAFLIAACGGGGGGGDSAPPVGGNPIPPNNAPVISGSPDTSTEAGTTYSFTPTASDPDAGDRLTFSIENQPYWMQFDDTTGTLSGTPFAADIADYLDIRISVSDGSATASLSPFGIAVTPEKLGEANFVPKGTVTPTENGYNAVGTLDLSSSELVQSFENADLNLEFDEEGKLVSFYGTTDLPGNLDDRITVPAGIRAVVGMMTGKEISEDEDFGIQLVHDTNYFVFYLGADVEIVLTEQDPVDPDQTLQHTVTTPFAGELILITDPTDPMLYYFGGTPLLADYGSGHSASSQLPFIPELDFAGLDSFKGRTLENGAMGLGVKFVDFFTIGGTRVVKKHDLRDINWDDPLASDIEFRAGINGIFDFGLSVIGFGLLSFELVDGSATIDVGLDRQQMAMALRLAPDTSFLPDWVHVVPDAEIEGAASFNGNGDYAFELAGAWKSRLPEADVAGSMEIVNEGVTLTGSTSENGDTLAVSMEFLNNETIGRVGFPESYSESLTSDVSTALDNEIAKVEQALSELEEASENYEFEVSLRGLREALPPMMDTAINTLNGIPNTVYNDARAAAIDKIENTCKTVTIDPGFGLPSYDVTRCLEDVVNKNDIADSVASSARTRARENIVPYKEVMQDLKQRAQQADDEALREGLRQALLTAYENRTYSETIKITRKIDAGVFDATYTMYNETYKKKVLSDAQASQVLTAHQNAHLIQESSDIMISAQEVFDALPLEETISQVKQEVQDGITAVPQPEGLGYRAFGDNYEAFVTIDGADHVIDINVLKPSEVKDGVSDLLADVLLNAVQ